MDELMDILWPRWDLGLQNRGVMKQAAFVCIWVDALMGMWIHTDIWVWCTCICAYTWWAYIYERVGLHTHPQGIHTYIIRWCGG